MTELQTTKEWEESRQAALTFIIDQGTVAARRRLAVRIRQDYENESQPALVESCVECALNGTKGINEMSDLDLASWMAGYFGSIATIREFLK